jgi:hypothetical protein
MPAKREKLTVEIDPDLRDALARWATEEARPLGNLLRRISGHFLEPVPIIGADEHPANPANLVRRRSNAAIRSNRVLFVWSDIPASILNQSD